ncbi:SRPBCC family protein [Sinomonas sp. ASV322]|uniref:SRPBCC family protein n=1 Tax=Sinomonas sp. ASV322 TaxID=3041920 RepID=UPI0027DD9228|nr:SRPBCC family protein [Sinomonas sp. ASV322]MDQ4503436.1 SRPBCC family protein [Sinomonas sp. ASV322]
MSAFTITRSAFIPAPPEQIFPHINSFHNWTSWSPWEDLDPTLERAYSGPESGVGAQYAWQGNRKVGSGRMEIVESTEPSRVALRLEFLKPWKAVNPTSFTLEPQSGGTRVTWTMTGENRGVAQIFALFMNMDKMVGKDFEKGLARLSQVATTV